MCFVLLEPHFVFHICVAEDEEDYEESASPGGDKAELQTVLKTLSAKLEDLQTCSDLIAKQCAALQRALADAESVAADNNPQEVMQKMKAVNERATLFRITSSAMVNVSAQPIVFSVKHVKKQKYGACMHAGLWRVCSAGPVSGSQVAENVVTRA